MKKESVIVLVGPPGSGKGTQAKIIAEKFNLEYLRTSGFLKKRSKKEDYTGNKINESMDKGGRVATPVVFMLWMEELERLKKKKNFKGFVFDGSPRTVFEAEMLEIALDWYGWNNKKVFFIKLSKKKAIGRITKRRICKNCGEIPLGLKENDKCLRCGRMLISRSDDSLARVNKRWQWYIKEVLPVTKYYEKKGCLTTINGNQSIEDVSKDILKKMV